MVAVSSGMAGVGCGRSGPPSGAVLETRRVFGESGTAPGQFGHPRVLENDGQSLWVIDRLARVQRLDAQDGRALDEWNTPKFDRGKPTGLGVFVPRSTPDEPWLLIADTHEHRVLIMRPGPRREGELVMRTPEVVAQFGEYGLGDGQFVYPTDVLAIPSADGESIARLYVGEYGGNDRVNIWEPAGHEGGAGTLAFRFVRSFGAFGSGDGSDGRVEFSRPQSLTWDRARNELVITDACNHRIGRFTMDGALVRWFGSPQRPTDEPGAFNFPYGVAVLEDGTALVAEFGNNRLQRIDLTDGTCLGLFGSTGRRVGQLSTPWAVTVLGREVFVLDTGNNRIQVMDLPRGRQAVRVAHDDRADAPGAAGRGTP